jgi:hypothetical protein
MGSSNLVAVMGKPSQRMRAALQVQASILEIYNESIFDLLSDSPRATADKLDIKELGCAALHVAAYAAECFATFIVLHASKRVGVMSAA